MKIYSVNDPEFAAYGKVLGGYDTKELLDAMNAIKMPEGGVAYEPSIDSLEKCAIAKKFCDGAFGGLASELGMCWGYNTKLNCLEYHRGSEINVGTTDFILLLAKLSDIEDGKLDTSKVKAFEAPAGACVLVYETSLHYAPCRNNPEGFRVAVVLPAGTNTDKPEFTPVNDEDKLLWARNKWLIAHEDSSEAKAGAYVGLTGKNLDIAVD